MKLLHSNPGDLVGITFQNITIAAPSILGEPDVLWGFQGGNHHQFSYFFMKVKICATGGAIRNLVFENLVIGGEKIEEAEHFYTNEYVHDLQFS